MTRHVYALFYLDAKHVAAKRYFYVGRSNDVARRISEHIRLSAQGHEDKYEFIRQLEQDGVEWDVEVLRVIPDGEYPPDNERWFVIQLTRDGHQLTNMRHGSAEYRRELARQVSAVHIRSVGDVARDRVSAQDQRAARKQGASRRLRRRILEAALRQEGIPDLAADRLLPRRLHARLLREDIGSVEKGVSLSWLVGIARPDEARRKFKDFVREIEATYPLPKPRLAE